MCDKEVTPSTSTVNNIKIITPQQLKKMGLSEKLQNVIKSKIKSSTKQTKRSNLKVGNNTDDKSNSDASVTDSQRSARVGKKSRNKAITDTGSSLKDTISLQSFEDLKLRKKTTLLDIVNEKCDKNIDVGIMEEKLNCIDVNFKNIDNIEQEKDNTSRRRSSRKSVQNKKYQDFDCNINYSSENTPESCNTETKKRKSKSSKTVKIEVSNADTVKEESELENRKTIAKSKTKLKTTITEKKSEVKERKSSTNSTESNKMNDEQNEIGTSVKKAKQKSKHSINKISSEQSDHNNVNSNNKLKQQLDNDNKIVDSLMESDVIRKSLDGNQTFDMKNTNKSKTSKENIINKNTDEHVEIPKTKLAVKTYNKRKASSSPLVDINKNNDKNDSKVEAPISELNVKIDEDKHNKNDDVIMSKHKRNSVLTDDKSSNEGTLDNVKKKGRKPKRAKIVKSPSLEGSFNEVNNENVNFEKPSTSTDNNDVNKNDSIVSLNETLNVSVEPVKKKRGRPPKVRTEEETTRKRKLSESSESTTETQRKWIKTDIRINEGDEAIPENEEPLTKQTRILVTNYVNDVKNNIKNNSFIMPTEEPTEKKPEGHKRVKIVKCGLCKYEMADSVWGSHKHRWHNDIAWKEGEKPLDLNDVALIMKILNNIYKNRKLFYCDKCNDVKKSVLGLLSHKMQCGRTTDEVEAIKIKCDMCQKNVMPFLWVDHVRQHKRQELVVKKIEESILNEETSDREDENNGSKRKAAKRASLLIQDFVKDANEFKLSGNQIKRYCIKNQNDVESFVIDKIKNEIEINKEGFCKIEGCDLKFNTIEEAEVHLKECKFRIKEMYTCKVCCLMTKSFYTTSLHIKNCHKDDIERDDCDVNYKNQDNSSESESDEEVTANKKKLTKSTTDTNCKFYNLKFVNLVKSGYTIEARYFSTLKFYEKNYVNNSTNFSKVLPKFTPLSKQQIADYLPKLFYSVPTIHRTVKTYNKHIDPANEKCHSYNIFEATLSEQGSTIFCGGPVSSLAWAPTPLNVNCEQVLAVSVLPDPDKRYEMTKVYEDKCILQFWNYGVLSSKSNASTPRLQFCLSHNFGPIWKMEWCPSGCYNENDNILGVLAVTTSTRKSYCFVIPFTISNESKIYESKPSFILTPRGCDLTTGFKNYHGSSICWSKERRHKYIAIGYTTGIVALYNLESTSDILLSSNNDNDAKEIFPYLTFPAHNHSITGIQLSPVCGGNKFLATASYDHSIKIWDLDDLSKCLKCVKKTLITDLTWVLNSVILMDGHADQTIPQITSLTHIRDFSGPSSAGIMYSNSQITGVDKSDWCGFYMQISQEGEAIGCMIRNPYVFHTEMNIKRYFLTYTTLFNTTEINDEDKWCNVSYLSAKNYTLAFSDFPLHNLKKLQKGSDSITGFRAVHQQVNLNRYPLQSLTALSINPNKQSFVFNAVGYQAGFVRVLHSRFLNYY